LQGDLNFDLFYAIYAVTNWTIISMPPIKQRRHGFTVPDSGSSDRDLHILRDISKHQAYLFVLAGLRDNSDSGANRVLAKTINL
jgi:hypothetical protein